MTVPRQFILLLVSLLTGCAPKEPVTVVHGTLAAMAGGFGHAPGDFAGRPFMTRAHRPADLSPPVYDPIAAPGTHGLTHGTIGQDLSWTLELPHLTAEVLQPVTRLHNLPDGCVILGEKITPEGAHFADLMVGAEAEHPVAPPEDPWLPPGYERLVFEQVQVLGPGKARRIERGLRFVDRDVQVRNQIRCQTGGGFFTGTHTLELKAGWNLMEAGTVAEDPGDQTGKSEQTITVVPLDTPLVLTSTH